MAIGSHMVITETRLTKKFITDEEGAGLLSPRIVAEKSPVVERRRFYVLFADIGKLSGISVAYIAWKSDKTTSG